MNQLIIYILNGLFIGICEKIDTAFGNNISLDAICVLSAYTVITWITHCTYQMGSYSYRVTLDKEKNNFLIQLISSVILGVTIFVLSDKIPYLYSLTDSQYKLFTKCLKAHALSLPIIAIGEFVNNYLVIKCMNKLMWIANIILYILMILFDVIVFYNDKDLDSLIVVTGIAYVIYDIIVMKFSGIFKIKDKINFENIKTCTRHAMNMWTDRILGKVATITFNIYASKLGTEVYAVHCICYSISTFTENITNQQFNYQVIKLKNIHTAKDKWEKCKNILKTTFLPIGLLGYIASFILLLVIHGEVSVNSCIVPLILYCSQVFLIQFYENLRGYLTSLSRSDILKWAGLIGIFVRIPVTLISYYTNIGLYGFALASSIDFLFRGIYFYIMSKKILYNKSIKIEA